MADAYLPVVCNCVHTQLLDCSGTSDFQRFERDTNSFLKASDPLQSRQVNQNRVLRYTGNATHQSEPPDLQELRPSDGRRRPRVGPRERLTLRGRRGRLRDE